jgi:aminoglycoside phosphotransferase family enzyme
LNARLAPGVYLGVMALQWRGGRFALIPDPAPPADACTVDWLVRMRRLPAPRMLDRAIAQALVGHREIDALVRVLGAFYRSVPVIDLEPADWAARFQHDLALGRELLLRPQFQLRDAATALDRYDQALARCGGALHERALRGRIVDGHGDLRPEHVCLIEPPVVIDCLEFNAPLRQVDPFDEIAFLGLECEMAGAAWIGPQLAAGCALALADTPPAALLHLYSAGRALLRARLAVAHLLDPQPRMAHKWQPLAERYLVRCLARLKALERGDAFSAATSRGNP